MENNAIDNKIEIEWSYSPANYFEEQINLERENYSIEISDGHITAKMRADVFDSQPGLRDSLSQELKDYFLGAQPFRRQSFDIRGGAIIRIWPDGRRDTTLVIQSAVHMQTAGHIDLVYTDQKGVVHDTRRDRIKATKSVAELSARHAGSNLTARKLLDSFDAAVRDPKNELIHLYEVWDALQKEFRGKEKAQSTLGISVHERSRFGRLANIEPLNQGRHRGQHAGSLRDATSEELDEAREIARHMLASYLEHLDKKQRE